VIARSLPPSLQGGETSETRQTGEEAVHDRTRYELIGNVLLRYCSTSPCL
jgi:hypothetical protein